MIKAPAPEKIALKSNSTLILILTIILSFNSCATEIDSVPQSIHDFLDSYDWQMDLFRKSDVSDLSGFRSHERWYLFDGTIEQAWSVYTTIIPPEQWNGPIARFGLLYDPETSMILTPSSERFPPVRVGNILFLDLLIEDFLHVPTSFQISRIDETTKTLEFTYLEQNTSHGYQEMKFLSVEDGKKTLIRHRSQFKSDSPLRDALFYRAYHTQTVDEFHWTVAEHAGVSLDILSPRQIKKKGLLPHGTAP